MLWTLAENERKSHCREGKKESFLKASQVWEKKQEHNKKYINVQFFCAVNILKPFLFCIK